MGNRCKIDIAHADILGLFTKETGSLQQQKDTGWEAILVDISPPPIWRKSFGAVSIYAGEGGSSST